MPKRSRLTAIFRKSIPVCMMRAKDALSNSFRFFLRSFRIAFWSDPKENGQKTKSGSRLRSIMDACFPFCFDGFCFVKKDRSGSDFCLFSDTKKIRRCRTGENIMPPVHAVPDLPPANSTMLYFQCRSRQFSPNPRVCFPCFILAEKDEMFEYKRKNVSFRT